MMHDLALVDRRAVRSFPLSFDDRRTRLAAAAVLVVATFAAFFIVEHDLAMSLKSEDGSDAAFVEIELDSDVESGSTLRKLGFLALGAIGFGCLVFPGRPLNWRSLVPYAAVGFGVWLIASMTWSVDSSLCLRRVIVASMMMLALAAYVRLFSAFDAANVVGGLSLAFIAIGFASELALLQFRPWASGYRLGGTTHPNTFGILCAFGTFYAISRSFAVDRRRQVLWLGVAGIAFAALVLTKSRTALAATIVAVGFLWLWRANWATRIFAVVLSVTGLSALILASLVFEIDAVSTVIDAVLLGRSEQVTTLTGRTPLWAELNRDVAESPIAGYGFGSFWTPDVLYRVRQNQGWQIPHAHSAYYETVLNLGFVGLALAVLAVVAAGVRACRFDSRENVGSGLTIATVVFAAIYSVTDTAFALPTFASFSLALLVLHTTRLDRVAGVSDSVASSVGEGVR